MYPNRQVAGGLFSVKMPCGDDSYVEGICDQVESNKWKASELIVWKLTHPPKRSTLQGATTRSHGTPNDKSKSSYQSYVTAIDLDKGASELPHDQLIKVAFKEQPQADCLHVLIELSAPTLPSPSEDEPRESLASA